MCTDFNLILFKFFATIKLIKFKINIRNKHGGINLEAISRSQAVEALLKQLKNPFDPKFVKCRVGATNKDKTKGIALFYVDAREVMKRLNEVCGMDGWDIPDKKETAHGVMCKLSLRMPYTDKDGKEVWRSRVDFGEFSKTSPLKGASSDALKRTAVNFGVGMYLYYIPNSWYQIDKYGKFVETPTMPAWANPNPNIEDWENVAILEYDPAKDVGLDEMIFVDDEAQDELTNRTHTREEIMQALKAKKK